MASSEVSSSATPDTAAVVDEFLFLATDGETIHWTIRDEHASDLALLLWERESRPESRPQSKFKSLQGILLNILLLACGEKSINQNKSPFARLFKPSRIALSASRCGGCNDKYLINVRRWGNSAFLKNFVNMRKPCCPTRRLALLTAKALLGVEKDLDVVVICKFDKRLYGACICYNCRFLIFFSKQNQIFYAWIELYEVATPYNTGFCIGNPAEALNSRHVYKDAGLTSPVIDNILRLVSGCDKTHVRCRRNAVPLLPTRVLDLVDPKRPRLIETENERGDYIAVSYCWGTEEFIQTRNANVNQRKSGISWTDLPRVFQESISISLRLGIRYVWIDALCILQDDKTDWEVESSKMCDIYANSFATIAATCASDPKDSFLKPRSPTKKIFLRDRRNRKRTLFARALIGHDGARSDGFHPSLDPLLTRGWAYQERRLSRRILDFTSREVVFRCNEGCQCECGEQQITPESNARGVLEIRAEVDEIIEDKEDALERWNTDVKDFARLDLTYESDRLPALSGLANRYSKYGLGRYLAGMWEAALPECLFWVNHALTYGEYQLRTEPDFTVEPSASRLKSLPTSSHNVPSWSWAGRSGELLIFRSFGYAPLPCVAEASCRLAGQDPYGAVLSGELRLHGLLKECSLESLSGRFDLKVLIDEWWKNELDSSQIVNVLGFRGVLDDQDNSMALPSALILIKSRTKVGAFERVGVCLGPWSAKSSRRDLTPFFEGVDITTVTLV